MTKREAIESLRKKLQERDADSRWWNRDLYNALMEHARWLIKREIGAGRIYTNNSFFQTLGCIEVIETSVTEPCCPVKTKCRIYRTKEKLPEMWIDNGGPVIRSVTSVDNTTEFVPTSVIGWQVKRQDPYQKMHDTKYTFFADGYLWFPEHNPHRVNIVGFYTDDISSKSDCGKKSNECSRWLDTQWVLPDWLHAECFAKTLQLLIPTKRMPEDEQVDKNTMRRT